VPPHRWFAACLLCLLWVARSHAADEGVREYVDETTAASITASTRALIFARERTDLAVNARDYITLVPVEINRSGKRACFWSGYLWSTIDRRKRESWLAKGDELVLLADGRPMPLRNSTTTLRDQGVAEPITPSPARRAIAVLFAVNPEEIAYVSHASQVRIELLHAGTTETFTLWKGQPDTLSTFAEHIAP
jgi:hypothetical protein